MDIGAYNKQLENLQEAKDEISSLQQLVKDLADKVTIYEELKKAFSQDGVPHNIIRSIVPMLEATANNILGQMSGGKMSVEFVTEKLLKSNNKKEVVTLDIFINDNGRLPYLSKSGGERVKSSLSVILALAEIKSSRAGIQLGMLFIDEPPFLDSDGIQAYCDALETIQNRYSGLKIMAITHDPTMKARFPQSIDIEKTEEGSRVIYG
jgi:exonuclease SbcC